VKRRVVITGMGLLSPVGNDVASTWRGLLDGVNGVGPITQFDTSNFPVKFGCELKGFDPKLLKRPRWLVFNKVDLLPPEEREKTAKAIVKRSPDLFGCENRRGIDRFVRLARGRPAAKLFGGPCFPPVGASKQLHQRCGVHHAPPPCLFGVQCLLVRRRYPRSDLGCRFIVLHGYPRKRPNRDSRTHALDIMLCFLWKFELPARSDVKTADGRATKSPANFAGL